MKSAIFTVLTAVSGSFAMVTERDTAVKQVLIDVTTSIGYLGAAANATDSNVDQLLKAADNVIYSIQNGQKACQEAAPIGLGDAIGLVDPIQNLDSTATALYDSIQARVGDVEEAKQCETTRNKLGVINTAGHQLINIVINKFSSDLTKNMAQQYVGDTTELLSKYQALFSASNCVDYK